MKQKERLENRARRIEHKDVNTEEINTPDKSVASSSKNTIAGSHPREGLEREFKMAQDPDAYRWGRGSPKQRGDTKEAIKAYIAFEGMMLPKEVRLMQDAQDQLQRHYLNPAFMLYINNTNKTDNVESIFMDAFNHPFDLRYEIFPHEVVKITKAGYATNSTIPDNFLIKIEHGNITEMRGEDEEDTEVIVNLKADNPNDPLPWVNEGEYNKKINHLNDRFGAEYYDKILPRAEAEMNKLPSGTPAGDEKWIEVFNRILESDTDGETLQLYYTNNLQFIKNIKKLIDARGLEIDRSHRYYPEINKLAVTANAPNRPDKYLEPYIIYSAPGQNDVYLINELIYEQNGNARIEFRAAISVDGYFMEKDIKTGKWVKNPLYKDILERRYYSAHPKARNRLSEDLQNEMDSSDTQEGIEVASDNKSKNIHTILANLNDVTVEQITAIVNVLEPGFVTDYGTADIPDVVNYISTELRSHANTYSDQQVLNILNILNLSPTASNADITETQEESDKESPNITPEQMEIYKFVTNAVNGTEEEFVTETMRILNLQAVSKEDMQGLAGNILLPEINEDFNSMSKEALLEKIKVQLKSEIGKEGDGFTGYIEAIRTFLKEKLEMRLSALKKLSNTG